MAKAIYQGVSGVARKVKQPFVGVSGVARKVKNAFVGVGGVARQFLDPGMVTVTITGTGDSTYCYVTINNTKYTAPATLQVSPKTSVKLSVKKNDRNTGQQTNGTKYLNGATYTFSNYQVTGNTTFKLEVASDTTYSQHGIIYITTS